ncbi:Scr1 family TA system antitoxin-like transcriptional regulator [Streptosporangium sp. OZ121]|uniref:Scr1 family TA system antitoxin-like transcriptional regulator n=1 Tax=Streptosporangium sp. OZ121 TaxID=3444183 RepID=UPI003F79C4A1
MREQLGHLLEITRRTTVSIQIVSPECLTGLMGAFTIAELPDGQPGALHALRPRRVEVVHRWRQDRRVRHSDLTFHPLGSSIATPPGRS